jgi:hypothetical protein
MAIHEQGCDHMAPDEAGCSGQQYAHGQVLVR